MKYIASCSFGKDSLATIILAYLHNEPLDEVVYARVMFDSITSAEIPEHENFIQNIAIPTLHRLGYRVTTVTADANFVDDCFFRKRCKGASCGKYGGFPIPGRCEVQRDLKIKAIKQIEKMYPSNSVIQYLGIAVDEPIRLERLKSNQISLLQKYGITEAGATWICKYFGLLSPIYEFTKRGGCFFCPNATLNELNHLKIHHPDLWQRLLDLSRVQNKANTRFNRDYTLEQIDRLLTTKEVNNDTISR